MPSLRALRLPHLLLAGGLLAAGAARADIVVSIAGNVAEAQIELEDALGASYEAVFRLTFEQPQNLTEACLGLSADLLDAAGIAAVDARLPDPAGQAIDPAFPMRITVEPPPACGLAFVNDVQIELVTGDLVYTAFSPYRLMKAPVGGAFADITGAIESGSVRARGRGGGFSEFVLATDLSQDYAPEAEDLLDELADELQDPDIALTAQTTLDIAIALVAAAYADDDFVAALAALDSFDADLRGFAGEAVPNRYAADAPDGDDLGEIAALAAALRFRLARLSGAP
ncbi:DUF6689 family protein [Chiayiivirga flava]|uniref:Uncharacterized protein n=1 Tax=Chiayiivirga flava TaxID=659595 RepID=A0A7W8D568_9GAMM|nr:DUF6689 family protein [Chiayiivirga flava]MBB5206897.1 hypothetical protein [Chiayiivirga flava]